MYCFSITGKGGYLSICKSLFPSKRSISIFIIPGEEDLRHLFPPNRQGTGVSRYSRYGLQHRAPILQAILRPGAGNILELTAQQVAEEASEAPERPGFLIIILNADILCLSLMADGTAQITSGIWIYSKKSKALQTSVTQPFLSF